MKDVMVLELTVIKLFLAPIRDDAQGILGTGI
jgi:hypothetical protein